MSPRSIRRAAERQARKLEKRHNSPSVKAARLDEAAVLSAPKTQEEDPAERQAAKQARKAELSEAQLAANRGNAQLSTGPTSDAGKTTSSLNAVKTGLTGRTVLLPADDAEAYRRHIAAYDAEYKPVGLRECELVQSLADTQWRLNRIPGLESAIYALGHIEPLSGTVDEPTLLSEAKIQRELTTHLKYEKSLRNLQLQEARLIRRYKSEISELRDLQKERREADGALTTSADSETEPLAPSIRTNDTHFGFEFSTADFIIDTTASGGSASARVEREH